MLAKIRANTPLTPAERDIHDAGQITLLRHLHDRLDAAVAAAYGWPATLTDAEIVARIVALNAERHAEEQAGTIRWLRPEFQAPLAQAQTRPTVQPTLDLTDATIAMLWPRTQPAAQFILLRDTLAQLPAAATPLEIARRIPGAPRTPRLTEMLDTLTALGQAHKTPDNRYTA